MILVVQSRLNYAIHFSCFVKVDMIMKAMKQAFSDALQASAHLNLCDTCPIQILHRLCAKVEGMFHVLVMNYS